MVEISEASESRGEARLSTAREANWPAVLFFIHIHLLSLYGLWLVLFEVKLVTIIFLATLVLMGVQGVTAGAHRLWAHAAYSAGTPLKIYLMLCQTLAGQGSIYEWVKSHRFHHAHFGTELDPHDHNKGFVHAHILTRLRKLSPAQERLRDNIDMSDLEKDSIVMFQKRFYWLLYAVLFVVLPMNAPMEYWDESVLGAVFVVGLLRYGAVLHAAWLVESGMCVWGLKSGEKYPPDTNAVFILNKTFWPQYHYIIPYDYKSGEFGSYDCGCTSGFIRVWAALGLATKLRTVEPATLQVALAEAARSKRPLPVCIQEAVDKQVLPEDHYLTRG